VDVLSPNYRGSSGYGIRYEEAGDVNLRTEDVVAACKYARSLHGGHSHVILLGTSYGAYLAASAAASDPQDISGVILLSMVPGKAEHLPFKGLTLPVFCFHGENDPLSPQRAKGVIESFFGPGALGREQNLWQVFPNEGHVFRHTASWAEVYTAVQTMVRSISEKQVRRMSS
jgi:pimeloyl-ACP methyl ester carboxylesterase